MLFALSFLVTIPSLIILTIMKLRRIDARHDLLGQAVILSLTSVPEEWKRDHSSCWNSPLGQVTRRERYQQSTVYEFQGGSLSLLNGKRIFKMLDKREEERMAEVIRIRGQEYLDKAIKQAQGKLQKVIENERRTQSA